MIRGLMLDDVLFVARRMRAEDVRCIRAMVGDFTVESFSVNRWSAEGPAWCMTDAAGSPLVVAGLQFVNGWTAVPWILAVEGVPAHSWRKAIRFARTVLRNAVDPANRFSRRRIEAHVMADWPQAREFAQRMGFEMESTKRAAGMDGEDVQVWTVVREGSQMTTSYRIGQSWVSVADTPADHQQSGSNAVNASRTITALGTPAGGTVSVTALQTLKFTYGSVTGVTRCGIQLLNGAAIVGYINYPDGDNQLFAVPAGMTALGFNVVELDNAGSIALNIASI